MPVVSVRTVTNDDTSLLHRLASSCPPLDVHTPYTYWVLCHMFADGCFVAEVDGDPIGFVTTMRKDDRGFLWQIGVLPASRGQGITRDLLSAVIDWAKSHRLPHIELSIDPENSASLATFRGFASRHGLSFDSVGSLDLSVEADPEFSEREDVYALSIPS